VDSSPAGSALELVGKMENMVIPPRCQEPTISWSPFLQNIKRKPGLLGGFEKSGTRTQFNTAAIQQAEIYERNGTKGS
jgi:hypothetical protein